MALTFPLPLETWFQDIGKASMTFDLQDAYQMDGLRDGANIWTDLGSRLWAGSVTVRPHRFVNAEAVMAKWRALREARGSFWATPDHVARANGTATIRETSNNRLLGLNGLGAGTVIPAGSFFSFSYASGTRFALHQFAETITANGLGNGNVVEILPPLQPGFSIGGIVELAAPRCKAKIVPGNVAALIQPGYVGQFSFSWVQSIK